ncbi:MAG: ATP-binding protein [Pseudomonadota bacterium]
MTLPGLVAEYLRDRLFERRLPLCVTLDKENRIISIDGSRRESLLADTQLGAKIDEALPVLVGHPMTETVELPLVGLADGVFDIHVLPNPSGAFVVLLDSGLEHELLQRSQQTTNEVRLLHANQSKLIRRMREMIGELVEARSELDHRRREAEKHAVQQTRFIAMMSHEFRTPLASIINYADLALDSTADSATITRSNEAISRASRHLSTLVEAVLDDAKIEAGQVKVSISPFAVTELIEDLTMIMAPLAAEKSLGFSAMVSDAVPSYIETDATVIRQILINLLGNAIKFTDAGAITLNVDWRNDAIHLVVTDTGPGIPVADRERMLEAFERGQRRDREGAGLGLSICAKLANLLEGKVEIDSGYQGGCRIIVNLPATDAGEPNTPSPVLPQPSSADTAKASAVILLCDDDEDMLALAEYYLHQVGYALLLARDGLEAVEKALAYDPDLILMDINTPRLNGVDATNRLRQSGFTKPIIALTASDARYFDQAAFSDYLRKPIQMPRLMQEINKQLG